MNLDHEQMITHLTLAGWTPADIGLGAVQNFARNEGYYVVEATPLLTQIQHLNFAIPKFTTGEWCMATSTLRLLFTYMEKVHAM